MTHQVLARKFRPKQFSEVIGQPIIVQSLLHALRTGKTHHAYLLTGTRGVGKTTVGRLIAKALNCTHNDSNTCFPEPCSTCENCQALDRQCAPDLIEVDGASKTKVEEIRALLENVQYLPNQGKYRIYLIDEVHMLSIHSFNALLKTLEEPPAHVIFILATTEPHKIPITIFSRCLQLAFQSLSESELTRQLEKITQQENIIFESPALRRLAQAGMGSFRDALSLLEQAISVGLGKVTEVAVSQMLGISTRLNQMDILESIVHKKTDFLFDMIRELGTQSIDFKQLLNSLMEVLHEIALKQVHQNTRTEFESVQDRLFKLAHIITPEQVQVFYQIVLEGQKNFAYMPDPQRGFEMICLRLLAFQPLELGEQDLNIPEPVARLSQEKIPERPEKLEIPETPSILEVPEMLGLPEIPNDPDSQIEHTKPPQTNQWPHILSNLKLTGLAQVIAKQCTIGGGSIESGRMQLLLSSGHRLLLNPVQVEKIQSAVSEYAGQSIKVSIDIASSQAVATQSMSQSLEQQNPTHSARVSQAELAIKSEPKIHALMQHPTGQAIIQSLQAKLVRVSPIESVQK